MRVPDSIDFFQVLGIQSLTLELFAAWDARLSEKVSDDQWQAEIGSVDPVLGGLARCGEGSAPETNH